jgi:hypothetical protein
MTIFKYQINIFLAIWGIFLAGLLTLGTMFTLSRISNDSKITQAQVENIGKPVIVEQKYFSPMIK